MLTSHPGFSLVVKCAFSALLFAPLATSATQTVTVGAHPIALAVNTVTRKVYVANYSSASVTVIDGVSDDTTVVPTGAYPMALAVNELSNRIYVVNQGSNNVTVIDGTTNGTTTVAVGSNPGSVAINTQANQIYVTNQDDSSVTIIDGADNTTKTVNVGLYPYAVAVNEVTSRIYVANMMGNTVTLIDGLTHQTTTIQVGPSPEFLTVDSQRNKIFIANYGGGTVTVIDGVTNATSNIPSGQSPITITLDPTTNDIYVVNDVAAGTVTTINVDTKATTTYPVGSYPVALEMDLSVNNLYVSNSSDNTVSVIDVGKGTIKSTPVGKSPRAMKRLASKVYIANYNDGTVTIIDPTVAPPNGPRAVPAPTQISFGNQTVNTTSGSEVVTLWNSGDAILNIGSIGLTGNNPSEFRLTNACDTTLSAGATCKLSVAFSPSGTGTFGAAITFVDDAADSPQSVSLDGTGTLLFGAQAVVSPHSISFGSQTVNTSSQAQVVTLSNPGTSTLHITSIAIAQPNATVFRVTENCGTAIVETDSCELSVSFTPNVTGTFTGVLTIRDDAPDSQQTVTLSGTGGPLLYPQAALQPATVTFDNQTAGTSSVSHVVVLSNPGTVPLNVASIGITGTGSKDFLSSNSCAIQLAPGDSCAISLTFAPSTAGLSTAKLLVVDEAADSPQSTTLTGTGVLAASPGGGGGESGPDFLLVTATPPQTVAVGAAAQYSITVLSTSGVFNNAVTLSASGLPTGCIATFTPSTATPGTDGSTSLLQIQTSAVTARLDHGEPKTQQTPWGYVGTTGFLATALLPFGKEKRETRRRRLFFLGALTVFATAFVSCGGGGVPQTRTSKSYTITVTGASGLSRHTTNVTLTLQ